MLSDRRPLGWTDLRVSALALGTMQFGWTLSDVQAMELLDAYVDAGGNLIDTADMYGPNQNWRSYQRCKPHLGISEDVIGRWMSDRHNRDQLVIATKVRAPMWDGPDGAGLSPAHIHRAIDDSLRRLRTDAIDLYQAHWPDPDTPIEETLAAFGQLIEKGKVRYVGLSNYAALGQLPTVLDLSGIADYPRIATEQPRFNLLNLAEYNETLRRAVQEHQLGVICYSPLASGFLTGKYRRHAGVPDSARVRFVKQYMTPEGWRLVDELETISEHRQVSTAAVALAWVIKQPGITAAIAGANSLEQLQQWLPATQLRLETAELQRLTDFGWAASAPEYTSW